MVLSDSTPENFANILQIREKMRSANGQLGENERQ